LNYASGVFASVAASFVKDSNKIYLFYSSSKSSSVA